MEARWSRETLAPCGGIRGREEAEGLRGGRRAEFEPAEVEGKEGRGMDEEAESDWRGTVSREECRLGVGREGGTRELVAGAREKAGEKRAEGRGWMVGAEARRWRLEELLSTTNASGSRGVEGRAGFVPRERGLSSRPKPSSASFSRPLERLFLPAELGSPVDDPKSAPAPRPTPRSRSSAA